MYRKYYSYNDMPRMVQKNEIAKCDEPKNQCKAECNRGNSPSLKLENDDIILGVIIVALLLDDCSDSSLLLALIFVFLSGLL